MQINKNRQDITWNVSYTFLPTLSTNYFKGIEMHCNDLSRK
jgi:hypothetical protein